MRSHDYLGPAREWIRALAAPLTGITVLAALLHGAQGLGLLPPARPTDNTDETLMAFKGQLIRSHHPAEVILLGDSSCGTGVEAPLLRRLLPGNPRVLNLGLYIGFGLDVYGDVLSTYLEHNPGTVNWVVLLVNPQFLMNNSAAPDALDYWQRIAQPDRYGQDPQRHWLTRWSGAELLKDRLFKRLLPTPIPGGGLYGFTSGLAQYLADHEGSMVDVGKFHPPAHPILDQYTLSPTLEKPSRDFRRRIPAGAKLVVGIMPIPASVCPPGYAEQRDQLLRAWNQWMGADHVLTNSPARMSDNCFATRTHPNEVGQTLYTHQLARSLTQALGP